MTFGFLCLYCIFKCSLQFGLHCLSWFHSQGQAVPSNVYMTQYTLYNKYEWNVAVCCAFRPNFYPVSPSAVVKNRCVTWIQPSVALLSPQHGIYRIRLSPKPNSGTFLWLPTLRTTLKKKHPNLNGAAAEHISGFRPRVWHWARCILGKGLW